MYRGVRLILKLSPPCLLASLPPCLLVSRPPPPLLSPSSPPPLPLPLSSSLLHALQHSNRLLSYTPPREAGSLG